MEKGEVFDLLLSHTFVSIRCRGELLLASMPNCTDAVPEQGSTPERKNRGRVPKKEHKSEREKLKRDHLNELFLELGRSLEPSSRQSNGKASILVDATRVLRYLIARKEMLRKENAALDTEYHYLTKEKDELRDENNVLQADIRRLQNELRGRTQSDQMWNNGIDMAPSTLDLPTTTAVQIQEQAAGPLYLISNHQELHPFSEAGNALASPKPASNVSKPRPRYPTPDSWPLELLSQHQREAHETHAVLAAEPHQTAHEAQIPAGNNKT